MALLVLGEHLVEGLAGFAAGLGFRNVWVGHEGLSFILKITPSLLRC
jgi:hypothetical protein